MKNFLISIAIVILINVSLYSQTPIIQKTIIQGENGFVANEVVMDSIMEEHYKFLDTLITNEKLTITLELLQAKIDKLNLQVDFVTNDNSRLELLNTNLKIQLKIKDRIHETDLQYYKEKAKGKITAFLLGTGAGALIIAVLTLL